MYMNYMASRIVRCKWKLFGVRTVTDKPSEQWGTESDDVAGVEAVRYLETKGVHVLTNPSTFLSKTKLDL